MQRKAVRKTELDVSGPSHANAVHESRHIYQTVFNILSDKINSQAFPDGLRIKEGQVANILGISRAPVRQAFELLLQQGLVRQTPGQGFLTGRQGGPVTKSVHEVGQILKQEMVEDVERNIAWEKIYRTVKQQVTECLPFGTYRVLESELSRHFSVSRTVGREVLARLADRNIIAKDRRSHWIAGPLTAKDIREVLEMRLLLEPHAFAESAKLVDRAIVVQMRDRVAQFEADPQKASSELIENIELDLHHTLLRYSQNKRLLASLDRNQLNIAIDNLFRRQFGNANDSKVIGDHALILDQILAGEFSVAQAALKAHLERNATEVLRKLRVLSVLPKPETAPYLLNVH